MDTSFSISDTFSPASHFPTFGDLVSILVKNVFVLAGIICFLMLVFGGLRVIMSAGSGDAKNLERGRQAVTSAVVGLFLVLGSFWILWILAELTGIDVLRNLIPF